MVLNFAHPLSAAHLQQIEEKTGQAVERVLAVTEIAVDERRRHSAPAQSPFLCAEYRHRNVHRSVAGRDGQIPVPDELERQTVNSL